jgi:hypothetical protein
MWLRGTGQLDFLSQKERASHGREDEEDQQATYKWSLSMRAPTTPFLSAGPSLPLY